MSEASVYRLLRADEVLTSPAFIVMKAADVSVRPQRAARQAGRA